MSARFYMGTGRKALQLRSSGTLDPTGLRDLVGSRIPRDRVCNCLVAKPL